MKALSTFYIPSRFSCLHSKEVTTTYSPPPHQWDLKVMIQHMFTTFHHLQVIVLPRCTLCRHHTLFASAIIALHKQVHIMAFSWDFSAPWSISLLEGGGRKWRRMQACHWYWHYFLIPKRAHSKCMIYFCVLSRAQHLLRICTHILTTPISSDLCPPMNKNIAPMPGPPKTHGHGYGHPM